MPELAVSTPIISDTDLVAEQLQLQLIRNAPSWRRAEMAGQMFETMKQLALSGLRQRHPHTTEDELRRRLAELLMGPDLARLAYGPQPESWRHHAD